MNSEFPVKFYKAYVRVTFKFLNENHFHKNIQMI